MPVFPNILTRPVPGKLFSNFRNSELGIIALALEEEDENWRRKLGRRKMKWIHNAWKSRPVEGEFYTLLPHLMDDETKFYEYFRMAQPTFHDLLMKLAVACLPRPHRPCQKNKLN